MLLKRIDTLSSTDNLAFILGDSDPLPDSILKQEELDYLESKKDENSKWLSINQYNRWIFIYRVKKDNKAEYLQLEKLRKAGAQLGKRLNGGQTQLSHGGCC